MAVYNTRGRDPLFDSNMQAAIERRGRELIGIALIALGLLAAAMIGSYTPEDPNWLVSTDAPVQNWMGGIGAAIAAPLFMVVGWGAWGLAIVPIAWGLRMILHWGEDRALGRVVFAPFAIAILSIYCATLVPGPDWTATHSFGLGGLFGDTVLGAVLTLLPVGSHFAVKLTSLLAGVGMLMIYAFVLGFTGPELRRGLRYVIYGLVLAYGALMTLLGKGATGAARIARHQAQMRAQAREDRQLAQRLAAEAAAEAEASAVIEDTPHPHEDQQPAEQPSGFFARMPGLIRRAESYDPQPELPQPEWVDPEPTAAMDPQYDQMPGDDRIRAKIANVVRSRQQADLPPQPDPTRPLTKGRGRGPDPLVLDTSAPVDLPPEPPVMAAQPPMRAEPVLTAQRPMQAPPVTAPVTVPVTAPVTAPVAAPVAAPRVAPVAAPVAPHPTPQPEPHFEPASETLAEVAPTPPIQRATGATPVSEPASAPLADPAPQVMQDAAPLPIPEPAPAPVAIPVAEPRKAVVEQPNRKPPQPSQRAQAEAQPTLEFEDPEVAFELPPLNLLTNPGDVQRHHLSDEALEENARMLENVLDDYGVKGEIVSVRPGPVVTMYELEPAPGLKASRVIGLADDIARSMSALSARVSTVPGRSVIGIELPNEKREMVVLREILASRDFGDSNQSLPLALGKDIGGDSVVANLAKMPHLLIAGTTGSGKSVAINTMILSLLYKLTPAECRLIMIDPKMLELSVYDGIPHLLSPVVTDPKKAVVALKWTVGEMEDRYRKMSKMGVRNIEGYNGRVREALAKGEMFSRTVQTGFDDDTGEPVFETEEFAPEALPYIVVIVDEMADLMMVAGKEIEACIQRLAQMARASGIHLIMATQRPSVDVITGTIKANFPTRISFQVTSKVDSRTILGEMGAEQLLGMGDLLYMAGGAKITRCHGPFVSDEEVEEVVNHLKQFGPAEYMSGVIDGPSEDKADNIDAVLGLNTGGNTNGEDALYDQAVAIVIKDRKCSTSYIQRKLAIGYNKAARLVEQMEEEGLVSPSNHVGKREILVPEQE